MEKMADCKVSRLDRVEQGLKELGVVVVGPRICKCNAIDQEYSSVKFYVAPTEMALTTGALQEFAGSVRKKLGAATNERETETHSGCVYLPFLHYQDTVASRSEDIWLHISDPRAGEVLDFPENIALVEGRVGFERLVEVKRRTQVYICPSRKIAEFAYEHYRDIVDR